MDSLEICDSSGAENISPEEADGQEHHSSKLKRFCSARYGLAIMIHFGFLITSSQSLSLSIAIIAMVNSTDHSNQSNVSTEGYPGATMDTGVPVYEWSPEIQGILLSVATYGILVSAIPAGYFAGILGGKIMAGISLFVISVLSLLIPLAADYGIFYLILIRIVQGMAQGIIFSSLPSHWQKWAPPLERSLLNNIGVSGLPLGNFITIFFGGIICQSPGWPTMFYMLGGIGCVFCVFWFALVYDDPRNHPFISKSEKDYIISSLDGQDNSFNWSLPYKVMFKSLPLWSILISSICQHWLNSNLTVSLPTLMNNMFGFTYEKTGFLSALPFLPAWIIMNLGAKIADFLLCKKIISLIMVRKLFTFLGMFFPSLFMTALPYVDFSTSVAFVVLALSTNQLCHSGIFINILDIAPRFYTFITGLVCVFTSISQILSSTTTGYLISQDPEAGWKNVFFLSSAINLAGMIVYLIFGQADIQDWAKKNRGTSF